LEPLLQCSSGNLQFHTDYADAVPLAEVIVIAVGLMVAAPGHDRMMFSDCLNEH